MTSTASLGWGRGRCCPQTGDRGGGSELDPDVRGIETVLPSSEADLGEPFSPQILGGPTARALGYERREWAGQRPS